MTDPSQPVPKGRSRTILFVLALCFLISLTGIAWLLWLFLARTPPVAIAPRDVSDQNTPATPSAGSTPGELTLHLDQSGSPISPTLYGIALEQINHSIDGGLYAELLPNANLAVSFRGIRGGTLKNVGGRMVVAGGELVTVAEYWYLSQIGDVKADMQPDPDPTAPSPKSRLRLTVSSIGSGGRAAVCNQGYSGIPVKPNCTYHASFYAKAGSDFSGPLVASIQSQESQTVFASATIDKIDQTWRRYDVDLKTPGNITPSYSNNIFEISTNHTGTVWLADFSLFPPTWKNRPNGNRIDLAQLLADLKPGFIIYPGGDTLLGRNPRFRFDWKKSIGPVELRMTIPSAWERLSNGFGLMEFLLTCEDLHAEPVLAIYDGTSRFQNVKPGKDLLPYVQDALDEIEYVTGDKSTTWAHAAPPTDTPIPSPSTSSRSATTSSFTTRKPTTHASRSSTTPSKPDIPT